jgi:predicted neutral ceramidase superfamily lipid hydrolase
MNKNAPAAQNTNAPSLLRSLWLGTCSRYTLLCLILLVTSAIAADSLTITYVDSVRFFLLLPFGFCLTLAAMTRRSATLSKGAKCALHPLITLGGFYLCCYLPYQVRTKPSGMQVFIILLLVIILYAIVMGIYAATVSKRNRKRSEETPYESQFSKS